MLSDSQRTFFSRVQKSCIFGSVQFIVNDTTLNHNKIIRGIRPREMQATSSIHGSRCRILLSRRFSSHAERGRARVFRNHPMSFPLSLCLFLCLFRRSLPVPLSAFSFACLCLSSLPGFPVSSPSLPGRVVSFSFPDTSRHCLVQGAHPPWNEQT